MIVDGEWWERLRDIAGLVPGLPDGTVRAWASTGRVRRVRIDGEAWVSMGDVFDAEAASVRRRSAGAERDVAK